MGLLKQFTTNFSKVMRKHVFLSMLGMAALFLVNGCQKPTMDPPYLTLVGESEFTIDANGGPGSVEYRVTNPVQGASVSLSTDPAEVDWVTGLAAASGAVTFNVEVNTAMEERSAKVILSYPQAAETVEFTIKQAAAGKPVIKLASTTVSVTSAGGPASLAYEVTNALDGVKLNVTNLPEWITGLEVGAEEITFNVGANTGEKRSAEVVVSYTNADNVSFTVNQFGGGDYEINPNWTVSYAGKGKTDDGYSDLIDVTVNSGSDGYLPAVLTVEELDQYGIGQYAEALVAYYQEMLDYYEQAGVPGMPTSWEDLLLTETVTNLAMGILDSSSQWYAIAVGVTNDGVPTGAYAISDIFTPEEIQASEAYNKWLGDWRIEDAEGVGFDITLSVLEPEISFNMSGWEPGIFQGADTPPVEVAFDSTTGNLVFVPSSNIGNYQITVTAEDGSRDVCTLGFYGSDNGEGYYWPNADIAEAVLSGDDASTVTGITFEAQDGMGGTEQVTMGSMCFILESIQTTSAYSATNPELIPQFPLTMTRTAASAGASAKSTGLKPVGMKFKPVDSYKVPFAKLCETGALNVRTARMVK